MPDHADSILKVKGANLKFGDNWALHDVSIGLRPGETQVFFGAAGSGKTTLLKAVIGLVGVDTGSIKLFGEEVTTKSEHELYPLRSRVGFLFQEGGLFDSLTVGENVQYPFQNQQTKDSQPLSPEEMERRVRETLRFVELEHTINQFPSELSGGMRRRVGIARAIVTDPPLVLYDSPTAGLDPITANTIMALIAKQRDVRNSASLIVTHRYQDGELMANFHYDAVRQQLLPLSEEDQANGSKGTRFVVMNEGKIVFCGARAEMEASQDQYVRRFVRHEE